MQKRIYAFLLALVLMMASFGWAQAEGMETLDMAFGLFSVDVPVEWQMKAVDGDGLSDLSYKGSGLSIRANYSQASSYEQTALRNMESYISYMFVMVAGAGYTETGVQEETLENGVKLRWQLMQGEENHALWFEAYSDGFVYNMCLLGSADQSEKMLQTMRSFRVNPEREADILQLRQMKTEDGAFTSTNHGLQLQLTPEWNPVNMEELQLAQTAFLLEKGDGQLMIQLLYVKGLADGDTNGLFGWYTQMYGVYQPGTEPYTLHLDGLGVDAVVVETDGPVQAIHVAFVHEGVGYYGTFMWIKSLAEEARPVMMEALKSITVPAE